MKKLKVLLACCLSMALLVGCSSSSSDSSSSGDTTTYTYSSELDIKNLDSSDADDGMSFTAMHACIDGLMGLNEDVEITYALAENEEISDDGLTRTFTLRDAQWSNGEPVTADDFVYAWQRIIKVSGQYAYMFGSEGAAIQGADEIMDAVANLGEDETLDDDGWDALFEEYDYGVKALDEKTLEVKTTNYLAYFDELMTFPCYYPINEAFCEEAGDQYAKSASNVLANGAFIMETWEPGSQATYSKNPDYWNADAVQIDKLVLNLVQTPEVAATSFDSGETNFALINSSLVDKYKDTPEYTEINEGYLFYLSINFENEVLANENIRKALSLAIDREDLCENTLKDGSTPAAGFIPTGLSLDSNGEDFRATAETYTEYDPDAAQEALDAGLAELGVDSVSIELLYGTDESPMEILATYLENSFGQLDGLELTTQGVPKQVRIYTNQANGDYDIACTRWGPDYSDPTTYLNLLQSENSNNYGKYNSAEVDDLIKKIQTATDTDERWAYMQECEDVAMNDYAYIPIFEKGSVALTSTNVEGLVIRPVGVPYTFTYVHFTD